MALAQPIRPYSIITITKDAYTPMPTGSDLMDVKMCEACNRIGRKLRSVDYTLSAVQNLWKNSRQNSESIDIISDLTSLTTREVIFVLGINKCQEDLDTSNIGMSEYWIRAPRTKDGALVK